MNIITIARQIAFNGPIITTIFSMYHLWDRPAYCLLYIFGVILNLGTNTFLKQWIKQPRPDGYLHNIENAEVYAAKGQEYGMPSGHAQMVIYTLTYLILLGYDRTVILVVSLFSGATIIQRYLDNKHTPEQLIVGSVVGGALAWVLVYCKKLNLRGIVNKMY